MDRVAERPPEGVWMEDTANQGSSLVGGEDLKEASSR